jgi:hypothetical protein
VAIVGLFGRGAQAQAQEKSASATSLQLDVTISRYQGDKLVSSAPHTLMTAIGSGVGVPDRASLRSSLQVPMVSTTTTPAADGKPATTTQTTRYQDIGTSIDSMIRSADGTRFSVWVSISDSSVYPEPSPQKPLAGTPALRSFRSEHTSLLRDGQTTEFTAATDKVTGEIVKVRVTLKVLK